MGDSVTAKAITQMRMAAQAKAHSGTFPE